MKPGYVYIMTNKSNVVMYTGVTSDLIKRVFQHRNHLGHKRSFCYKYDLIKLVYYEFTEDILAAIVREKQIKAGSRANKLKLIENMNPRREDLFDSLVR